MKLISTIVLCLAVTLAPTAPVFAAPAAPKIETRKDLYKFLVENVRTRNQVMHALDISETSKESMAAIFEDLKVRMPDKVKMPDLKLRDDRLYVGKKMTALKIISYEPLKLELQGKIWNANSDMAADATYKSLVGFLEGKSQSASMMNFILPEANAGLFDTMLGGGIGGAGIGALAGVFAAGITGQPAQMGSFAMFGAILGGIGGAVIGASNQARQPSSTSNYYGNPYQGMQPQPYMYPQPYVYPPPQPPCGGPYPPCMVVPAQQGTPATY